MAEKEKPKEPMAEYQSYLGTATDNVKKVKKEHEKAAVNVYANIAKDFDKVDPKDHKKVYDLLAKASIAYKKHVKILNGAPNDEFELGEVIRALQENRLDPAEVVKKFQNGEGREVIETLMDHYLNTHIQGKHSVWYHKNIGLDYGKKNLLAKGYKTHHRSTDSAEKIAETLEHKILQQAAAQAKQ